MVGRGESNPRHNLLKPKHYRELARGVYQQKYQHAPPPRVGKSTLGGI